MQGYPIRQALALALVLGSGCGPGPDGTGDGTSVEQEGPPSMAELAGATYLGVEEAGGAAVLTAGSWEGEPWVEGGAARPGVHLLDGFELTGDVDGDGTDEALALLSASAGGTGENIYLAVVGRRDGRVTNVSTVLVGDRVQVRDWKFDDGRVVLGVLWAGPEDAMCCPGELATLVWLTDDTGGLVRDPRVSASERLSAAAIGGTEWVLREWSRGDPAGVDPEITLAYDQGRLGGTSGCNRYFTAVEEVDLPGDLRVGPVGSTMMACPDTVMAVERRFLGKLQGVSRFGFLVGRLVLSYEVGGEWGNMVFSARPAGDVPGEAE